MKGNTYDSGVIAQELGFSIRLLNSRIRAAVDKGTVIFSEEDRKKRGLSYEYSEKGKKKILDLVGGKVSKFKSIVRKSDSELDVELELEKELESVRFLKSRGYNVTK